MTQAVLHASTPGHGFLVPANHGGTPAGTPVSHHEKGRNERMKHA